MAAFSCHEGRVKDNLLFQPADVNIPYTLDGWIGTPLCHATRRNGRADSPWNDDEKQLRVISLLIDAKASVNCTDMKSLSPLHWARTPHIAKKLINAGALLNNRSLAWSSPLEFACCLGRLEVVQILLECRADATPVAYSDQNIEIKYSTRRQSGFSELSQKWNEDYEWEKRTRDCFLLVRASVSDALCSALGPFLSHDPSGIVVANALDDVVDYSVKEEE